MQARIAAEIEQCSNPASIVHPMIPPHAAQPGAQTSRRFSVHEPQLAAETPLQAIWLRMPSFWTCEPRFQSAGPCVGAPTPEARSSRVNISDTLVPRRA